ncbi:MAG: ankyrin repeat domain-containing protein [Ginsengibacter sp.]
MHIVSNVFGILIGSIFLLLSCGNSSESSQNMHKSMNTQTLHEAVSSGNKEMVLELLKMKPDLEERDASGRTPLMVATYNADKEIAKILIDAGADVNAQDNMLNSPFLYAGASGYLDIVKWCLENGADFTVFNRYGGSALIPAAEKRHLEVVDLLVNTPGYPIDHINNLGWTALLEAIILGGKSKVQVEIVKTLVKGGSDVNIADKDGVSPLAHAKQRSMKEIQNILLEAGAK